MPEKKKSIIYTLKNGVKYYKSHTGTDNKRIEEDGSTYRVGWIGYYSANDVKSFKVQFPVRGGTLDDFIENFIKFSPQMGNVLGGCLIYSSHDKKRGYGIKKVINIEEEQ